MKSTDADKETPSAARGAGVDKLKKHSDLRENGALGRRDGVRWRVARNGRGSGSGGSAGNKLHRGGRTRGHRIGSGHCGPR